MHNVVARDGRNVRTVGVACAVLFVLGVVGAVTVDRSSVAETRLVGAAAATARIGTARAVVTSTVSVGGTEVVVKGEGLADFAGQKASLTMQHPRIGTVRLVTVGKMIYLQGATYQAVSKGKPWVSMDATRFGSQALEGSSGNGTDLLSALRTLQDEGVVRQARRVGADEVRGVRAVHYVGELDPDRLLRDAPAVGGRTGEAVQSVHVRSATIAVWVSDDGLVRRLETSTSMAMGDTTLDAGTTIELFDFGVPVQVEVPQAGQVHPLDGPAGLGG